jgi:hypothetical protein
MGIAILLWAMMVASCSYAVLFGGWEGKCMATVIAIAALVTAFWDISPGLRGSYVDLAPLSINLATLIAMYLIAAYSWRWWPLWVAAIQLNIAVAHLAALFSPPLSTLLSQGPEGCWALPGLALMVLGIFRDRLWKYRYDLA